MEECANGSFSIKKGDIDMITSTTALIVSVVLVAFVLLVLGICILRCLFRPILRSGMQLLVALVCIPVALLIAKAVGGAFKDMLLGLFDVPILDVILTDLPSAPEAIGSLVQMITAPILFVAIYLVLWLILGAIVGIVVRSLERGRSKVACYRNAGIGVAMANAQPEVKEAADVITLSNNEDGLVPIIEKYFLGE